MKGFLRWLLRPLVLWLADRKRVQFGVVESQHDVIGFLMIDGWGLCYFVERTPDQIREYAWGLIGEADAIESAANRSYLER
jgi:hypothetical protein